MHPTSLRHVHIVGNIAHEFVIISLALIPFQGLQGPLCVSSGEWWTRPDRAEPSVSWHGSCGLFRPRLPLCSFDEGAQVVACERGVQRLKPGFRLLCCHGEGWELSRGLWWILY